MTNKVKLTMAEKIDRAKDGRSQSWIVNKMNIQLKEKAITTVQFSRKKHEQDNQEFTEQEMSVLSEILGVDLSK